MKMLTFRATARAARRRGKTYILMSIIQDLHPDVNHPEPAAGSPPLTFPHTAAGIKHKRAADHKSDHKSDQQKIRTGHQPAALRNRVLLEALPKLLT